MDVGQLVEWELRGETCPSAIYLPQIPHNLTWDRTRAAAVGSRRLTTWAMARPLLKHVWLSFLCLWVYENCYSKIACISLVHTVHIYNAGCGYVRRVNCGVWTTLYWGMYNINSHVSSVLLSLRKIMLSLMTKSSGKNWWYISFSLQFEYLIREVGKDNIVACRPVAR
jgi:hypothetical protein